MEEQNNKPDKLTDKAFSRLLVTSILGILVCVACLCSGTWAWFTASVAGSDNEIKMADNCLLTVTVAASGEALENIESGVELVTGVTYTVTLSLPANTGSGYCLIKTTNDTYYTDYIARHEGETVTVSFDLTVGETQTVTFTPRWGIYAGDCDVVTDESGSYLHIS